MPEYERNGLLHCRAKALAENALHVLYPHVLGTPPFPVDICRACGYYGWYFFFVCFSWKGLSPAGREGYVRRDFAGQVGRCGRKSERRMSVWNGMGMEGSPFISSQFLGGSSSIRVRLSFSFCVLCGYGVPRCEQPSSNGMCSACHLL